MSLPPSQTAARPQGRSTRSVPTTARGSAFGAPASLLLHGLAVAAIFFALQSSLTPLKESGMVPVDLVVAEETNVAAAAAPEPQQETFERPPLEPLAPPPVPDMVEPAPIDVKPPQFKIEPPKRETPKNDLASLLNQLTAPERSPRNTARTAPRASEAIGAGNAATASLADALRSQIRNCWNPIPGAPNPADQVVSFGLRLNQDGTVAKLELLTINGNAYTAAAAEAASRAIYQCQPYRLPLDRYAQWQEFRPLRFDPRQMLPQ